MVSPIAIIVAVFFSLRAKIHGRTNTAQAGHISFLYLWGSKKRETRRKASSPGERLKEGKCAV
jgi:hypothetical protein